MGIMFHLQALSYTSENHTLILPRIDAVIPPQAISWFHGRSGSGLTTLLRILTQHIRPSTGSLIVHYDKLGLSDHATIPQYQQVVGQVYPHAPLFQEWRLYDNLMFPLEVLNEPYQERHEKVEGMMQLFGLTPYQHTTINLCPKATTLKTILARALILSPKILMIDRILLLLDDDDKQNLLRILHKLTSHGLTVIVADPSPPVTQPPVCAFGIPSP